MKTYTILARLELLNLFGLNTLKHEKDPSKKRNRIIILCVILATILLMEAYFTSGAYFLSLLGFAEKVPMLYSLVAMAFVFVFGIFKAKDYLYRTKDADLLSSLPLSGHAIVAARLFHIYFENVLFTALIFLPPSILCGIMGHFGIFFYANILMALLLLPILPTALLAIFGIFVTALIARNRHKALTETVFMFVILICSFLPALLIPTNNVNISLEQLNSSDKTLSREAMAALAAPVSEALSQLQSFLPFLKAWESFFLGKNILGLLLFGLVSFLCLSLTGYAAGRSLFAITRKLAPTFQHQEYHLTDLQAESILKSLLHKEARRYFSCGIYITNTIVGPILAVVFAVSLAFYEPAAIFERIEGLPVSVNANAALPFLIGMIFSMMVPSASSLSLEGKNWWILQSLPLSEKDIINAKLSFSLLLFAPFYVLSEIILLFTVRAGLFERLILLAAPACCILFAVTFGLFINSKLPKFEWESEMVVVKQSAATGISMLSLFAALLPGLLVMMLPAHLSGPASLGFLALLGGLTWFFYHNIHLPFM